MAQLKLSNKHVQVDKANFLIVCVMSAACFVTIFSLVAAKSLLSQRAYQARVIDAKHQARDQLNKNLQARDQLVTQYKAFEETQVNSIGGSSTGSGPRDGDNAKLVLDALPSKYDYPALTTSIEKLINESSLVIKSISGVDDEVQQLVTQTEAKPVKVEMPFDMGVEGKSVQIDTFFSMLERSIRPFQIRTITISGNDASLKATIEGVAYYQPEKVLQITTEVVK